MNRFRPQALPKSYVMKQRLKYGRTDNYTWQTRVRWYPAGWGFNRRVLGNIHSRLHYLACHAPVPIQQRWRAVYNTFYQRHFGTHQASMRYLDTWSCHAWL